MIAAPASLAAPTRVRDVQRDIPRVLRLWREQPRAPAAATETDSAARLLRRLDVASATPTPESMAALRAVVTEMVDRLKAAGMPRERVLATVERIVSDRDPTSARRDDTVAYRRVLAWCADAYRDDAWW